MSKLAHSHQPSMDKIERDALARDERGERDEPVERPYRNAHVAEPLRGIINNFSSKVSKP